MDQQLTNIPAMAKQVRLSVHKEGEAQQGYRLASAKGSPLLNQLGLQSGDVILEINGMQLSDTSQAVTALQSLRNAEEINILIDRKGTRKNLVYSVK
jgi:general secretion pathway protein C